MGTGFRTFGIVKAASKRDSLTLLCKQGLLKEAMELADDADLDSGTYACLLRGCGSIKTLSDGKRIHAIIISRNIDQNVFLGNHLIEMYRKCENLSDAIWVFVHLVNRGVLAWTSIISAYVNYGKYTEARKLFVQMHLEGVEADKIVFMTILNACFPSDALEEARFIHNLIISYGLALDLLVGSALVNMYGKCGSPLEAWKVFSKMSQRDVVLWTTMIAICGEHGYYKEALDLFQKMQLDGVPPNKITFVAVLNSFAVSDDLAGGLLMHAKINSYGFDTDIIVGNALFNMYCKCGTMELTQKIFQDLHQRDVISWNILLGACVNHGKYKDTLLYIHEMLLQHVKPNRITFLAMLDACISLAALANGKMVHASIVKFDFELDTVVRTALINMYGKCGALEDGYIVFHRMHQKDVVTWTAMISLYVEHGLGKDGLRLYRQMREERMKPDHLSFVSILDACVSLADSAEGALVHANIVDAGLEANGLVQCALINMYGKCGSLELAHKVFHGIKQPDDIIWNTLISAYSQNGSARDSFQVFRSMVEKGLEPNEVTLVAILSACSHAGLVHEGFQFFVSFPMDYNVTVAVEHHGCMIDLLGRIGWLEEAEDLLHKMPMAADDIVWMALFSACRMHGHVETEAMPKICTR